jgi:anti-sigma B factor antagonist
MSSSHPIDFPFRLSQQELRPDSWEIKIEGELNLSVVGQLIGALDLASGYSTVLIDLSQCEFIDSTGVDVIISAVRTMREEGRRLALYSPNPSVFRFLQVIGLDFDGLVFDSREAALRNEPDSSGTG